MPRAISTAALILTASLLMNCSGSSGPAGMIAGPDDELEGTWMFAADPQDAPRVDSCTGDLAGSNFQFCDSIDIVIQQDGDTFSGIGTDLFCGLSYTVSGTVVDDDVTGTLVATGVAATTRTSFTGFLAGPDALTVTLSSLTIDGLSGSCLLAGKYGATGTPIGSPALTMTMNPVRPEAGREVTFTLVGDAASESITSSRIDFDGGGTWDASASHNDSSITQAYEHTYLADGSYAVVAQILNGADVLAEIEAAVTVVPVVSLELDSLSNPPVTAQELGEGVCSGSPTVTCSNDTDCIAVGGPCVGLGCTIEVVDWTATFSNVPLRPSAQSPMDDVVLESVTISYDWFGDVTNTPTRTVGLGDVTLSVDASRSVSFPPIAFQDLSPAILGQSASLSLQFNGQTQQGVSVAVAAQRQLFVESCE